MPQKNSSRYYMLAALAAVVLMYLYSRNQKVEGLANTPVSIFNIPVKTVAPLPFNPIKIVGPTVNKIVSTPIPPAPPKVPIATMEERRGPGPSLTNEEALEIMNSSPETAYRYFAIFAIASQAIPRDGEKLLNEFANANPKMMNACFHYINNLRNEIKNGPAPTQVKNEITKI